MPIDPALSPDADTDHRADHDLDQDAVPWWRDAVVYQVYPRSFADADGDGIGDLPGITEHLPYLADLGVDAVWLSPFYPSPQADAGYDVADFRDVDPLFGSLADFDHLVEVATGLRLRVIVDLVPNHTSSRHPWFVEALASPPGSAARARYLFRDGRGEHGEQPPNNWPSVFGGGAWTRVTEADGEPGQWYLHLFEEGQPDLDWQNPEVRAEFEDVLRFWLDRGVSGFRVDVAHGLVKESGLPDLDVAARTRMVGEASADDADPHEQPGPIWDQDGVHEIYRAWRAVLDSYPDDRAMVAEAWVPDLSRIALYVRPDEFQQAFNFDFLTTTWSADAVRRSIVTSLGANAEVGAPTTWVLSNHDVVRHASRFGLPTPGGNPNGVFATDPQPDADLGLRRARALTLLMLALPGSAYLYQGEELGLPEHTTLDDSVRQDPVFRHTQGEEAGRDGCRVPLPWRADAPAYGFNDTGRAWLPQPEAFARHAADVEAADPASTLSMYRAALRLRRDLDLGRGSLEWIEGLGEDLVALRNGATTVVVNLGITAAHLPAGDVLVASTADAVDDEGRLAATAAVWLS